MADEDGAATEDHPGSAADNSNSDTKGSLDDAAPAASWRTYWQALRPWSFSASVTPVLLGVALAVRGTDAPLRPALLLSSLLTALSVHAAGNLVNTYFDFLLGVDSARATCDDRTLVDRLLRPADVERMATGLYALGTGAFVATAIGAGSRAALALTLLFVVGMSGSFLYTGGGPLALKYRALGELLVFTVFGPVTVAFAFAAHAGLGLSAALWRPLLLATPLALNTVAILHANNLRDAAADAALRGRLTTVATALGARRARLLLAALLLLPYVVCAVLAARWSAAFLLPLASAGRALALVRVAAAVRTGREPSLRRLPYRIARLNLALGGLYVAAVLLAPREAFVGVL